jgi:hypothetical protein
VKIRAQFFAPFHARSNLSIGVERAAILVGYPMSVSSYLAGLPWENRMYRKLIFASIFVAFLALMAAPVFADTTADPHISICQVCPAGTDPNLITNTSSFQIGWDGNHASVGPMLIIVGTYNNGAAPTVTFGANSYTPGTNGGTAPPLFGWTGVQDVSFSVANGTNSAYAALGIAPEGGGSSEQFLAWTGGQTANGITAATSFGLYVYEIPNVTLPANNTFISMDLEGATTGSYVLAYACEGTENPCSSGDLGSVPFTTAGLVDTVTAPEPSSLMLLGTGLIGLLGLARRRFAS